MFCVSSGYFEAHHVFQTAAHHSVLALQQLTTVALPHNPNIPQNLTHAYSSLEVLLQHATDQRFGLLGTSTPCGTVETDRLLVNLLEDLGVVFACEGRVSREEDVEGDT